MKLKVIKFQLAVILLSCIFISASAQTNKEEAIDRISKAIDKEFINPEIFDQVSKEQVPNFVKLRQKVRKKYGPIADRLMLTAISRFFYIKSYYLPSSAKFVTDRTETVTNKYLKDFIKYKNELLKKYPDSIDATTLNADAWYVFWNSANERHLAFALTWIESAIKQAPDDLYYLDTKANILYKLGHNDEALSLQRKAASNGHEELQNNLRKMEAGQPTWFVPTI